MILPQRVKLLLLLGQQWHGVLLLFRTVFIIGWVQVEEWIISVLPGGFDQYSIAFGVPAPIGKK